MLTRRSLLKSTAAAGLCATTGTQAMAGLPDDFYVPAEELRHEQTFMQWPASRDAYPRKSHLRAVQQVIANIANTIAQFEPVIMLADAALHAEARQLLSESVTLWDVPTDDLWCRDSGPLFAVNGRGGLAISHIQFNGWGRYRHPADEALAQTVARHMGLPIYDANLVGEPGGAEANGHGLVMANESSWINRNRNPGLGKDEVTARLASAYGADTVLWGPGVKGKDVTDAHIDGVARFTAPNRVLMHRDTSDPNDPFTKADEVLFSVLKNAGLEIDTIPYSFEGRRRDVGFYVNFYVCNGAVIASEFGDPEPDQIALEALRRHYPNREIITLDTDILIDLGGGIHCATQQMPAT